MSLSPNVRRRSTGCAGMCMNSTPSAGPHRVALKAARHQQALREWLETRRGWWPKWRAPSWPTSSGSPPISMRWKSASANVPRGRPDPAGYPGCGELTAAKSSARPPGSARFKSEAGVRLPRRNSPHTAWSGATKGQMRLSRSGNRQLNAAIHRIAVTQIPMQRQPGPRLLSKTKAPKDGQGRSPTLPQTPHSPPRLPSPPRRPPNPKSSPTTGGGLT